MADIPKKFKVYSTGAGFAGPWCRTLVDSYNKKYDSEAILMIKPGTGGLLATLDMLKDPEFSIQCAAGMSEMFFNRLQYPTYAKELEMISIINMCCESPVMFNTRLSNSFNTLPELLASKKILTIGHHTTAGKIIATKIFNPNSTFVNFKSATDALPSIVSGDIDVYIDVYIDLFIEECNTFFNNKIREITTEYFIFCENDFILLPNFEYSIEKSLEDIQNILICENVASVLEWQSIRADYNYIY